MKKRKSDYAFVVSCNPGYGFGLLSSMNAQAHFGTNADWEIACDGFAPEYMEKVSNSFPFNVNWTPINDLIKEVNDRRTDQSCTLERFWLAYWLLAHRLLREKKYKAVCVIQGDTFVFTNLDVFFNIASAGVFACSEFPFSLVNTEDLPCGDDKACWDRYMAGAFDSVTFVGQS